MVSLVRVLHILRWRRPNPFAQVCSQPTVLERVRRVRHRDARATGVQPSTMPAHPSSYHHYDHYHYYHYNHHYYHPTSSLSSTSISSRSQSRRTDPDNPSCRRHDRVRTRSRDFVHHHQHPYITARTTTSGRPSTTALTSPPSDNHAQNKGRNAPSISNDGRGRRCGGRQRTVL